MMIDNFFCLFLCLGIRHDISGLVLLTHSTRVTNEPKQIVYFYYSSMAYTIEKINNCVEIKPRIQHFTSIFCCILLLSNRVDYV